MINYITIQFTQFEDLWFVFIFKSSLRCTTLICELNYTVYVDIHDVSYQCPQESWDDVIVTSPSPTRTGSWILSGSGCELCHKGLKHCSSWSGGHRLSAGTQEGTQEPGDYLTFNPKRMICTLRCSFSLQLQNAIPNESLQTCTRTARLHTEHLLLPPTWSGLRSMYKVWLSS